uniref:Uncharacterized protein n=1 Tax=Glossina brevipalpis TaxID=37001 RepID=A0A1A9WXZ9_9MUSC
MLSTSLIFSMIGLSSFEGHLKNSSSTLRVSENSYRLLAVVDVVTFKSVASEVLVGVLLLLTVGAVEFAIVVIVVTVVVISLIALGDEVASNTSIIPPSPAPPPVLTAPKVFVAEILLSGVVKSDIVPISETSLLVSSALLSYNKNNT